MPVVRINSVESSPQLHGTSRPVWPTLRRLGRVPGPVIVMIHGYKYEPGHARHCPHRHILSLHPAPLPDAWPRPLGFGANLPAADPHDEGLGIAFGWNARGALWSAQARARDAGRVLARVIGELHRLAPARPVHIVAHSMGTEVALEALHHLPAGAVHRILSLTGACYRSRTAMALATPAGQSAEFINVTSRENDPFDFLFERLITPPQPGDRSIGQGLDGPGTVTLQLDCPERSITSAGSACRWPRPGAASAIGPPTPAPAFCRCTAPCCAGPMPFRWTRCAVACPPRPRRAGRGSSPCPQAPAACG